jgi:3-phenylpropionate/trans-cinnamate dioxygenase ferredoxin subunit
MLNYRTYPEDQLEYIVIASEDELPSGERIFLEIDGQPVAVFNIAGKYFAIADVCSHDDGPVAEGDLHDTQIECPRHGAKFDLESGKALTLPAVVDIPAYPVRLANGEILIGLPIED